MHVSMRVPNDQPATNFLTKMSVKIPRNCTEQRKQGTSLNDSYGRRELLSYIFGKKEALIFNLHFPTF